jgi:ParB family chromosome partitioning protein
LAEAGRKENPPKLKSFSDILKPSDAPSRSPGASDASDGGRIVRLPLSEMHYFKGYPAMRTEMPFSGQPYYVRDDDPKMLETLESVKRRGVRTPGIVRPDPAGGYELISGHRRHRASELSGLPDMPVIIREMTDEEAVIELVDGNIQREDVLPSEKAWAYRMRLEAQKRQGARTDLTSSPVGTKSRTLDTVGEQAGDSRNQVHRYIRLTHLLSELLERIDAKKIAFRPAVELSYLKLSEQAMLLDAMENEQATLSLSQAQRLKKFSQEGNLTPESMRAILSEEKKPEAHKVILSGTQIGKYFPSSYTPQKIEATILHLLEQWQQANQRGQEG